MAEFEILYGHGVSREGELIDMGVANNLVEKSGSWYSYNGERIGQGKENVRQFLLDNPEAADEIDRNLREILLPKADAVVPDEADQDAAVGEA
jgi:recombination protein RecA